MNKSDENTPTTLPEWAVHISDVYRWAEEKPRPYGGRTTKRTLQWYSTTGLIPSPTRIGKEAYYRRDQIFAYLRAVEILTRKFNFLLSEVKRVLQKTRNIKEVDLGTDTEGEIHVEWAIVLLSQFLEGFLDYETHEASTADMTINGPDLSPDQENRIKTIREEIAKKLLGTNEDLEDLLRSDVISLEGELAEANQF